MIETIPNNKQVILFDGFCNLCNSSVLFIIKQDKKNQFLFSPLQSEIGKTIVNEFDIDTEKIDSILLYRPNERKVDYKSTAALKIAKSLGFPINIVSVFFIIPTVIRDWVYDFIAKNRYKWFGKKEACMIPTPELKAKFLD